MTEEELTLIGMTREEWDEITTSERIYELKWARRIDQDKL
tara:strand:+ start:606 stop:725 length:120 start_codon:yes stop_codon:yes gene_type:complete